MTDDELHEEFGDLVARFEKDDDDLEYAKFELPTFRQFRDRVLVQHMEYEGGTQRMIGVKVMDANTLMSGLAAVAGVDFYILDADRNPIPRPAEMTDPEWSEWITNNAREKLSTYGAYMVSTVFSGVRRSDEDEDEIALWETAVFITDTREKVEGTLFTNDKAQALRWHTMMEGKYSRYKDSA